MMTFAVFEVIPEMVTYVKAISNHNFTLSYGETTYIEVQHYAAASPVRLAGPQTPTRITFFDDAEGLMFQLKFSEVVQLILIDEEKDE